MLTQGKFCINIIVQGKKKKKKEKEEKKKEKEEEEEGRNECVESSQTRGRWH